MPEALAEAELGAALIDHALERFNQDWLQERATVREEELGQLRTDLGEALAADTAALGQELQSLLPRAQRAALDQLFAVGALRVRLGEARALTAAPVVLEPLTLSRARRLRSWLPIRVEASGIGYGASPCPRGTAACPLAPHP